MKFINIFRHFHKINVHRFWVFYYCCKAGIPWRGLVHDLSKYSPTEFWESVKYYQGTSSPIDACKKVNGVSYAWMHHKGRNPHHYEYWQDNFDKGGNPVQMPDKYAIEMFCDYMGAGRAYMGKKFSYRQELNWWINKKHSPLAMHPVQKLFITEALNALLEDEKNKVKFHGQFKHAVLYGLNCAKWAYKDENKENIK